MTTLSVKCFYSVGYKTAADIGGTDDWLEAMVELLERSRADLLKRPRLVRNLMGFSAPSANLLSSVLVALALAVACIYTYRERRYWEGRLRQWQTRLSARIDVLHTLIADGQEIQHSYLTEGDPVSAHQAFIDRCDGSLGEHFGALYTTRIDTWPSGDWDQPRGLRSDEHVFAWYDIERRLAGLKGLLAEVEDDLRSLND